MLVTLDGSGPLYQQLYAALRSAILEGRLKPGARLPSTRTLARDAGVSRNTALLAYDQLLAEGYAVGKRGSGTYVAAELPESQLAARRTASADPRAGAASPRLSEYGRRLVDGPDFRLERPAVDRKRVYFDFRYGEPAVGEFPQDTWRRLLLRRTRSASQRSLAYGPPAGCPALREAIADYLRRARAVKCTADQVIVVSGSQQALDLCARVLLDAGDRVLLEDPTYQGARNVFLAAGASLVTLPVDGDGLDVSQLARAARQVRLAYVTPSHQFPAGAILALPRRLALLAWAQQTGAYLLEDDYDSEFRYDGRPVESMQGLDTAGRVIYIGTVSKVLFPALRIGYLVLPDALVEPFTTAKWLTDRGSATLEQEALADFISGGHFERHLRRSRTRNAERRAVLLDALQTHLGDRAAVMGANAGIHLVLWFPAIPAAGEAALIQRAAAAGVGVYPIAPYFAAPPQPAGLLLGYAALDTAGIREGIARLATVVD